jgi:YD repeat-containing protein
MLSTFCCASLGLSSEITYSYDSLHRLTNVDYGNGSVISYTYDAAGNRLTYSGAVANDTIAPTISITSPTTSSSYTNNSATINLSGTASDNTGVTLVTWQNYSGGIGVGFGDASGTNNWNITGIPLKYGVNFIVLTAYDAAGNSGYNTLTVTFAPGTGGTGTTTNTVFSEITGYHLANGIFHFALSGIVGSNYVIYASTDLKYWTPLSTNNIPSGGLITFVDSDAGIYPQRFYRAVPLGTAVSQPPGPPSPELTEISVSAGGAFQFNLNGAVGSNYVVQASSDLINWFDVATNLIPSGGVLDFSFPVSPNQPQMFYRAVPWTPESQIYIPAASGTITAPFILTNGYIYQPIQTTTVSDAGSVTYNFNIDQAGSYVIQTTVNASGGGANSFFVNIDAEPQSPTMIWDIFPFTSGFEQRTVSWRGTGFDTNNEYIPKVFNLTASPHQLIIRGREANTELQDITIVPYP